jgi:hypothetical protein
MEPGISAIGIYRTDAGKHLARTTMVALHDKPRMPHLDRHPSHASADGMRVFWKNMT